MERLLACPLRVAFEQASGPHGGARQGAWALVGIAIHRTIELCLDESAPDLPSAWEQACAELGERGIDPRGAPNARRAYLRLERRLPELLAYVADRAPTSVLREQVLTSPDGAVTGQVDLILLGERPSIIDHKTGVVLADGAPHERHQRQLALYAWLVQASLGVEVKEAALFSLREGIVAQDTSPATRDAVLDTALAARRSYNDRVPGPQPATPSATACGWCPFVGECGPAWEALRSGVLESLGWGEAALGTLRLPPTVTAGGKAAVSLDVRVGTVAGEVMIIDVPAELVRDRCVGAPLAGWHLARRSEEPVTLAWRDGSSLVPVAPSVVSAPGWDG